MLKVLESKRKHPNPMDIHLLRNIVLKSGPVGRPGPGQPEAETGPNEEKIENKKPGVTRLTRSKIRLQPVDFFY
jgi:hypothetical protein